MTTTSVTAAPVAKAATVAAAAGYTAATNQQWQMTALFGANPSAVLSQFNGKSVHIGDYDNGIDLTNAALKSSYDASRQVVIGGVVRIPPRAPATTARRPPASWWPLPRRSSSPSARRRPSIT